MRVAPPWLPPARAWALDGRALLVQCPPVFDLVPLLKVPTIYLLLLTLEDEADQGWLYERVVAYDSGVTDELLARAADELVYSWCGVPRWFAARLWTEILEQWPRFEGPLIGRGVDVAALSPARATRLVWSTLSTWHGHDKDHGDGWRRTIQAEPVAPVRRGPGRRVPPPADAGADAAGWMDVFNMTGGRAR